MNKKNILLACIAAISVLLCSCATNTEPPAPTSFEVVRDGAPKKKVDVTKIPNAVPQNEPLSRYGNPKKYSVAGTSYTVMRRGKNYKETGIASWYGTKFYRHRTSSGEPYNMYKMTAAHRTLPIPCYVRVTNLENRRYVVVKVNDRGPFKENRIIDLSYVAAIKLGITAKGTGLVEVDYIDPRHPSFKQTPLLINHHPKIYLQIGSFSKKSNALALRLKARKHTSYPIKITKFHLNRRCYYHVQIGPLKSVSASDYLHRHLKRAGFSQAITVLR